MDSQLSGVGWGIIQRVDQKAVRISRELNFAAATASFLKSLLLWFISEQSRIANNPNSIGSIQKRGRREAAPIST